MYVAYPIHVDDRIRHAITLQLLLIIDVDGKDWTAHAPVGLEKAALEWMNTVQQEVQYESQRPPVEGEHIEARVALSGRRNELRRLQRTENEHFSVGPRIHKKVH